jgi:phosphatidate cytidylyltransferase
MLPDRTAMLAVLETPETRLVWASLTILAALGLGSIVRLASWLGETRDPSGAHLASLRTWWIVVTLVVAASLGGITVAMLLLAAASLLAAQEFFQLTQGSGDDRLIVPLAHTMICISYAWVWLGWSLWFAAFLPLASLPVYSTLLVLRRCTSGFLRSICFPYVGALLPGYFLAHAGLVYHWEPAGGGWFLTLAVLTEWNDIVQALVGRRVGRRPILPRVSPNKTVEGWAGGLIATVALATVFAPWLTSLDRWQAAGGGLVIALAGFCGDSLLSAVKRDVGVKDSGRLLAGQGGVLDRVDSLTFAAPAFYYYVTLVHAPAGGLSAAG